MTGFSGDLQDQTVREPQRRALPKALNRSRHGVRILNRQLLMIQEHFDRGGNRLRPPIVDYVSTQVASASTR